MTDELTDALRDALAGGPPVAPLSPDPVERRRALAVLQPELPVTEPDAAAVLITSGSSGTPSRWCCPGRRSAPRSRRPMIGSAGRATGSWRCRATTWPDSWCRPGPCWPAPGLRPVRADLADLAGVATGRTVVATSPWFRPSWPGPARTPTCGPRSARFDAVLVGGGAADDALVARARAAGIRLVTTYGMTETCGGCVYDGRPLDGVTRRAGRGRGRIMIGGPMLFSGYRLQPDLTAEQPGRRPAAHCRPRPLASRAARGAGPAG